MNPSESSNAANVLDVLGRLWQGKYVARGTYRKARSLLDPDGSQGAGSNPLDRTPAPDPPAATGSLPPGTRRELLPTRHGFLWRAHFWTDHTHPQGYNYGGYYKFVRAWTKIGAMRLAERLRHRRWAFSVERWS